jgi:VanZ family protein
MSGALNTWFTYRFASQVLVLVLLALVFFLVEPPEPTMKWNALFDVGHFVLFAVAAWVLSDILERHRSGSRPVRTHSVVLLLITGLALGSEATQLLTPTRVASLADVSRDVAGGVAALALRTLRQSTMLTSRRRLLLSAVIAAVALAVLTPAFLVWEVYRARDHAFPTLLKLDESWQERWRIATRGATLQPAPCPTPESALIRCALLEFDGGGYPGVLIDEPYPDWTGYQTLAFSAWVRDTEPLVLGVVVYDRHYDGTDNMPFNENITLSRGHHDVAIPLARLRGSIHHRPLDLTAIRGMRLYAVHPSRPARITVSSIRLQ